MTSHDWTPIASEEVFLVLRAELVADAEVESALTAITTGRLNYGTLDGRILRYRMLRGFEQRAMTQPATPGVNEADADLLRRIVDMAQMMRHA